jgi:gamma-glutamyltranspeptidase/glutathione hydrolase/leukotriene-C4 hydrolase
MGIGGGFLMLHFSNADKKITVLDARETAPLLATVDMFNSCPKTHGGLSIAVPGELKGYWKAHQMFGQLEWGRLFRPAIEMCNNGFELSAPQAHHLKEFELKICESQAMREAFINRVTKQLYTANSIVRRPKLGKTFEVVAREGASAFYDGSLTDTIIGEISKQGGIITKADLQSYECLVKEPVTYKLRSGIEVNSLPSPSCGLLVNFILAIMDGSLIFLFFLILTVKNLC